MGMTINIDESIKELSKWRKDLNYDNGDYCYGGDTTEQSLETAIETMRKYQKIEELVEYHMLRYLPKKNKSGFYKDILEVLDNENDD